MSQAIEISIKSLFPERHRHLIINPAYMELDDNTRFEKNEITAFRYGVKWIRGYQLVIGRIYVVEIQSSGKRTINIRLKSLYGINKKVIGKQYLAIVNAIADNYFDDIARSYLKQFENNEPFKVEDVYFNTEGLSWNKNMPLIKWDDVGTKAYRTYYSIFSKSNPTIYKTFECLTDWNTGMIYSVSRSILMGKGLYKE